jgi:hypothetical protein
MKAAVNEGSAYQEDIALSQEQGRGKGALVLGEIRPGGLKFLKFS